MGEEVAGRDVVDEVVDRLLTVVLRVVAGELSGLSVVDDCTIDLSEFFEEAIGLNIEYLYGALPLVSKRHAHGSPQRGLRAACKVGLERGCYLEIKLPAIRD